MTTLEEHRVIFPPYIMMSDNNIKLLLSAFQEAYTAPQKLIILDFSALIFINGELTTLIAAFVRNLQITYHKQVVIDHNSVPRIHRNLFERNGLFKDFGLGHAEDKQDTTIELKTFNPTNSEEISRYIEEVLILKISNLSPSTNLDAALEKISPAIFELVDNIHTHAHSPLVIFAGQYYPKKNRITFAIADIGKSIPTTIREANVIPDSDDVTIIDWATEKGTTTKLEVESQTPGGLGLYVVKDIMQSHGELAIVSNHGFWKLHHSNGNTVIRQSELEIPFPGTIIQVSFLLDMMTEQIDLFDFNETSFQF